MSSCKLPLTFSPELLAADLARVEEADWHLHFNRGVYHGRWRVAALYAVGGSAARIEANPGRSLDVKPTPLLARCPYLQEVLGSFRCPLNTARLLGLGPGAGVGEHRDPGMAVADGEVRLHVPVTTSQQVEFRVAGEPVAMAAGECWFVDVSLPHSVVNNGPDERVHLVIDCVVDDWLRTLLPATPASSESSPFGGVDESNYLQIVEALRAQDSPTAHAMAEEILQHWGADDA